MFRQSATLSFLLLALLGQGANAQVSYEVLCPGFGLDISADGSVVVGNSQGDYETWRWTEASGLELLGRATFPVLGRGAGTPDVSADGTKISATILGADETYITQGRWTLGSGWEETMPPVPADGGLIDLSYGSAWGISGDGEHVLGFYWRPGNGGPKGDGLAHPSVWTSSEGITDLGTLLRNGRANDASYDASVIVGWDEREDGVWQPSVWQDGTLTRLGAYEGFSQATAVNSDGTIIGGQVYDESTSTGKAAVWRWDGASWVEDVIGSLPNTFETAQVEGISDDGSVIVGFNQFGAPGNSTGFIWTEEDGMVDVEDFLEDNGIVIDSNYNILTLTGVSADGTILVGAGQQNAPPFLASTFRITILDPASSPQLSADPLKLLMTAWPNPSFGESTISFDLPASEEAVLSIHDARGGLVRILEQGVFDSGPNQRLWDGRSDRGTPAAAGVYYLRLSGETLRAAGRLILIR